MGRRVMKSRGLITALFAAVGVVVTVPGVAHGQPKADPKKLAERDKALAAADRKQFAENMDVYKKNVRPFLEKHCIACHGPSGHGNPMAAWPRINGQHAAYLQKTLNEYASGSRISDADKNQMMRNIAELLLEDEIVALSSYIQGLQ